MFKAMASLLLTRSCHGSPVLSVLSRDCRSQRSARNTSTAFSSLASLEQLACSRCLVQSKGALSVRKCSKNQRPLGHHGAARSHHVAGELHDDVMVVVTREKGKNGKLMRALEQHGVKCMELPMIEHRHGQDRGLLAAAIRDGNFEWIIITSPEAASVFLEGWREAGEPAVTVAVVGGGTGEAIKAAEGSEKISIQFTPSKATAKVLAVEIPMLEGGSRKVLYPSSAKAGSDLEEGLKARGFEVVRLNTYSTVSVSDIDERLLAAAAAAPVATFASPTAVRAWNELVVARFGWQGSAACIGGTSAEAAKKAGMERVFFPDSPGIDGWVESVLKALEVAKETEQVTV